MCWHIYDRVCQPTSHLYVCIVHTKAPLQRLDNTKVFFLMIICGWNEQTNTCTHSRMHLKKMAQNFHCTFSLHILHIIIIHIFDIILRLWEMIWYNTIIVSWLASLPAHNSAKKSLLFYKIAQRAKKNAHLSFYKWKINANFRGDLMQFQTFSFFFGCCEPETKNPNEHEILVFVQTAQSTGSKLMIFDYIKCDVHFSFKCVLCWNSKKMHILIITFPLRSTLSTQFYFVGLGKC